MKLSEICIKRPVLAWVFTLVLVLIGLVGFYRLPVQRMPNIESVFLTIETQMPGVGPDIIESQITRHIEDAVSGIEGVDVIQSISSADESKVMVEFHATRSMDNAVNDVRDRLYRVKEKLPQANLRTEPMIHRSKNDEKPIMALALTSNKHTPSELFDYAENEIKKDLESIPGIARVEISGASPYVMKIDVDPLRMAIREAIENQNFESPAGRIESKDRMYNVTAVADLTKPQDFDNVIIKTEKGRIIRVRDIGKSSINADDKRTRTRFNGEPGVQIAISKQSNANPLQVAKDVKEAMKVITKKLPKGSSVSLAHDSTKYIEKSIKNVYWSIFEASLLVVLVVFFFLRSARASLIPLITIPISLIGVAFIMYMLGFTLNMFTLFAMVLAVGLVVDDAIVVLENIHRHMEDGVNAFQAAFKGIREVGFSIIAMTLTLVAVYLPIPLGSGKLAKYFTEFAITLAGAVLLSGFIALTLSPMMSARLLKSHNTPTDKKAKEAHNTLDTKEQPSSWMDKLPHTTWWNGVKEKINTEHFLVKCEEKYEQYLTKSLTVKPMVFKTMVLVSVLGYWVFAMMRSEPAPEEDSRSIRIEAHAPASSTLEYTERHLTKIDDILKAYPEIERRISAIINPNVDITLELTDESSSLLKQIGSIFMPKVRTTQNIMDELKKKFETVTGLDPRIRSGGSSDVNVVEFVVRGNKSQHELTGLVHQMTQEIFKTNLVAGIKSANNNDNEDYVITLNRDKIAAINRTPREVANHIRYLLKGEKIGTRFKKDNKQYDINLQVFSKFKENPEDVLKLYIRGGNTREAVLVPLSELVTIDSRSSPHEIHRYNRTRSATVVAILKPGHTVGEGIEAIDKIATETLPEGTQVEFIAETRRYITESKSMYLVFFLSLCFIYLILAAQFESWRDPLIIFFTVPLSMIGGVIALDQLDKGTLNMFSFIGFVTLIGLITKHGILIVDFANRLRDHGSLTMEAAIVRASKLRLRPILMTTCAMVLGAVPLMFGGAGNESRRQLGAVIIGGMTIGTIFTLFVVPTVYTLISSKKRQKKDHLDFDVHTT